MFRNLIIKYQEWRGRALDIWSAKSYPANVLSNLCSNGFRFEGVVCGSMEGFLQALKQKDPDKQRRICSMKGHKARKMSVAGWQTDQIVWWKGQPFDRQSRAYQHLLQRAYQAMFEQNERFRQALMATRGKTLCHSRGCRDPYRTILTEQEFCGILMQMRQQYDQRERGGTFGRKRILVDMDCLWADASRWDTHRLWLMPPGRCVCWSRVLRFFWLPEYPVRSLRPGPKGQNGCAHTMEECSGSVCCLPPCLLFVGEIIS